MTKVKNPRICPHCNKPIKRPPKPRDLGLLLHALCYRVPVHLEEITPEIIETFRKHCKMSPERLQELQGPDYERFWTYMQERRSRRLEYMMKSGEVPAYGWTPPKDNDPDRGRAVLAMHLHRVCAAKVRKHIKQGSKVYDERIAHAWDQSRRLKGVARIQGLNEILMMIHLKNKAGNDESLSTSEMLELNRTLGSGLERVRRERRKLREKRRKRKTAD